MSDNSKGIKDLEILSNMVYDSQIKDLIKEAIDCYNIGSYRASINLIWTSIAFDAYKKVKYLNEIHKEPSCKLIINEIKKKEDNNKSWEVYIIDQLQLLLKSITELEKDRLLFIYKIRNHCSHPILYDNDSNFFIPPAETVRHCLRDSIEILLSKPLLFGRKSLDIIFSEVSDDYFPKEYEIFNRSFIEKFLDKIVSDIVIKDLVNICIKKVFLDSNLDDNPKVTDKICLNILNSIWNYKNTKHFFEDNKNDILNKLESTKDLKLPNLIDFLCLNGNKSELVKDNNIIISKIVEFIKNNKTSATGVLEAIFTFGEKIEEYILESKFQKIIYIDLDQYSDFIEVLPDKIERIFFNSIFKNIETNQDFTDAEHKLYLCSRSFKYIKKREFLDDLINIIINNKGIITAYYSNQILSPSQAISNVSKILENLDSDLIEPNKDLITKLIDKLLEINRSGESPDFYYNEIFIQNFNERIKPTLESLVIDTYNLKSRSK